jgi:hypothetical protein
MRNAYRILVGKLEVKRPLGRIISKRVKEIGREDAGWIHLA